MGLIDDGLNLIKHNKNLAEEARRAGQFKKAQQHSAEAAGLAKKLDAAAQQGPDLSNEVSPLLRQAHLTTLESQRDDAIAISMREFRKEPEPFRYEDEVADFLEDLLCLHLEQLVDAGRLPTNNHYIKFLRDRHLD